MNNKSKTYIYPLFHDHLKLLLFSNLENTYLYNDCGENLFTLVYYFEENTGKNSIISSFIKLNSIFEDSTLLNDVIESDDGSKIAYVLNVPEEILPTYTLFQKGLYSKFPENFKYLITRFNKKYYPYFTKEIYNITAILFNNPEYRQELSKEFGYNIPEGIELSSKPNRELESFKKEKLNSEYMIT